MPKIPTLIIYWADTEVPLTYRERKEVELFGAIYEIVAMTPEEILIQEPGGRKIVVRGSTDPDAPHIPPPGNPFG